MFKRLVTAGITACFLIVCIGCSSQNPSSVVSNTAGQGSTMVAQDEAISINWSQVQLKLASGQQIPFLPKPFGPKLADRPFTMNGLKKTTGGTPVLIDWFQFWEMQPGCPATWSGCTHWIITDKGPYNVYQGDGSGNTICIAHSALKNVLLGAAFYASSGSGIVCELLGRVSSSYNAYYMAELNNQEVSIWKRIYSGGTYKYFKLAQQPISYQVGSWYYLHFYLENTYLESCLYTYEGQFIGGVGVNDGSISAAGRYGLGSNGRQIQIGEYLIWQIPD